MKSLIIFILFLPFFSQAQSNCTHCPPSKELYDKLLHKPVGINPRYFCNGCNINDSIRYRLLYLLIPGWTKEERNEYAIANIEEHKNIYNIDEKAKKIANNNDSLYKVSYDSLSKEVKKQIANNLPASIIGVNESVIRTVGYLDMKEAIPVLKKYFISYNTPVVKLALARLGNKGYQKEIINQSSPDSSLNYEKWQNDFQKKGMDLCYIATQESIYKLNEWIDTTKSLDFRTHTSKAANLVLQYLYNIILNEDFLIKIHSSLDFQDVYGLDNTDTNLLLYCKQWLIKNKGKYQISRNLYAWPDSRRVIKKSKP